jgi:hypothetical protein
MPGWLRWTLLALLGLAAAAAISLAASHLVSQRIGLASEPLSAGKELAPPPRVGPNDGHRHPPDSRKPSDAAPSTTAPSTPPAAPPATTSAPTITTAPAPAPAPPSDGSGERQSGGDD